MARRLHKTLVDYLAIAISPALIITLIASLVFFLIQVFYQGNFHGRLDYIMGLFVIGSVLTSRISIEEGRERAIMFALPLGLVTLVAVGQFVEFQGVLSSLSFVINLGLIGLVMWSADRLTWDCTLIDEAEDDGGQGLLESVGLERARGEAIGEGTEGDSPIFAQTKIGTVPAFPKGDSPIFAETKIGTVPRPPSPAPRPTSWWQRYVERRHRPHAPGVWVIYFSLAALPLFGLGQIFLPQSDLSARRYAFNLLFVYTASGLALLMSTSFLGLRRYLRQRGEEMPLRMVGLWLSIGSVLIAGVMLAALLLPRPNAEYAPPELGFRIGSPDQTSSRYGMGSDGVKEDKPWARTQPDENKEAGSAAGGKSSNKPSQDQSDKSDGKQASASKDGEKGESRQKSPGEKAAGKQSSDGKDGGNTKADSRSKSSGKKSAGKRTPDSKDGGNKKAERRAKSSGKTSRAGDKATAANRSSAESRESKADSKTIDAKARAEGQKSPEGRGSQSSSPRKFFERVRLPHSLPAFLLGLLKWIFYAALLALGVWWLVKNWEAILAAIREFWQRLFGGSARKSGITASQSEAPLTPPRPFSDYVNPFAAGTADRYSPEELVRYTFEALEAWAREHGTPRQPEQTPHEFARRLMGEVPTLGDDIARLADAYCQVAYAARTLRPTDLECLPRCWQSMEQSRSHSPLAATT